MDLFGFFSLLNRSPIRGTTIHQDCTEPARIAFHYASMFRHAMANRTEDGTISVKKLCYALRASLCVRWVVEKSTMLPTAFADVRAGLALSPEEEHSLDQLLRQKAGAGESDRVVPTAGLANLLQDRFEELQTMKWPRRSGTDVLPVLTRIFQQQSGIDVATSV